MSRVTRMDIPEANGVADALDQVAKDLNDALAELKNVCELTHGCWGDDEFGEKFAANYLPAVDEMLRNSETTRGDLEKIAGNIRETAKLFQNIDHEGGEHLELTDSPS
jgi:uncharacterized protein YukE